VPGPMVSSSWSVLLTTEALASAFTVDGVPALQLVPCYIVRYLHIMQPR
jgi:hypothetical protein